MSSLSDKHKAHRDAQIEEYKQWQEAKADSMKHWRSWGSWFSWGSPVGLGLFFLAIGITVWIFTQAF